MKPSKQGPLATHPLVAELAAHGGVPKLARPRKRLSHDRRNTDAAAVDASQRWRLLAAAAHVIATHGYAVATIDKITSKAGVTKKTFYKFFDSKEAVFLACYAAVDALIEGVAAAGLAAIDSGKDALRTVIARYLAALAAVPDLTRLFLFEALGASPRIRRQRAAYIERLVEGFQRVVAAQRARNPTIPALTDLEITLLLGGINELCVLHITRHDIATVTKLEDDIYQLVVRYHARPASSALLTPEDCRAPRGSGEGCSGKAAST